MSLERVYFTTEDRTELVGLLAKPEKPTDEVIISVHGMQSNCMKKREDILGTKANEWGIAYFAFNNRGHELAAYIKKTDGNSKPEGGSSYEDVYDSYYDIIAAIQKMLGLGYNKVHLQGHSLGCTKIIYAYNKLKDEDYAGILSCIKSVILLSLTDVVGTQKEDLGEHRYNELLNYAMDKERQNRGYELMPSKSFMHPMSARTYVKYFGEGNEKIDIARFSDKFYQFKEINSINVPLFMRWGTIYESISQELDELIPFLKDKIYNKHLDIGYIGGADHGYYGKEEALANEIMFFLKYLAE